MLICRLRYSKPITEVLTEISALPLNFHEVGNGAALDFVAFDSTGSLYSATKEQQFFGERSFTCVGVRHNGEGAPTVKFGDEVCHSS
jgi:hypothetical protein